MAIYTEADLAAITTAVLALATGTRTISVTFRGRSVTYQQAELADLMKLQASITADLAASAGTPRSRLASFSKGI